MGATMIRIKLSDLLGKHKMNQKTLSRLTNIRPATVSKMYYEETKRIEVSQINSICKALIVKFQNFLNMYQMKKNIKHHKAQKCTLRIIFDILRVHFLLHKLLKHCI